MPRGFTRSMSRAAARALGRQPAIAGLKRIVTGDGAGGFKVKFVFKDMTIAVTDALAYASKKLLDLPAGRAQIIGGVGSLQFGVTTARASTINDNADMDWAVGTAAASNITLATTMLDIIAKQDRTLNGAVAAYSTVSNANAAATAFFDGTTTPVDVYLNVAFPTNTDIDADGTLKVQGFIELNLRMLGDY